MSEYEVIQEHYLQEQEIQLDPGVRFWDGDLDPDIPPTLLDRGIIAVVGKHVPVPEPEPLPVEVVTEDVVPVPEEPAPPRVRRGHE